MPTPLPFAQLESFFQSLPIPTPPVWAIEESHRRIVVLINHVLMQEPEAMVRGQKPPVRIEGDVQLAAEVNWLADHVRWDLEEDLSRIIGDVPAHWLCQAGRTIAQAAHDFVAKAKAAAAPGKGA